MTTHKIEKDVVKIVMESIPPLSMFQSMRITLGDMDHGEMFPAISSWMMLTFQRKFRAFHNHDIDLNLMANLNLVSEKDVWRKGAWKTLPQGMIAI